MTRLSGMAITETKTFVRSEKFTWWKTPLKTWALKTHQNVHLHSISLFIWPCAVFTCMLTFSEIFMQNRALTEDIRVVSQAEMTKDGWMPGVEAMKEILILI